MLIGSFESENACWIDPEMKLFSPSTSVPLSQPGISRSASARSIVEVEGEKDTQEDQPGPGGSIR